VAPYVCECVSECVCVCVCVCVTESERESVRRVQEALESERQSVRRVQAALESERGETGTRFICFTGAKVGRGYSVYLLYWYKSTNTDAEGVETARLREAVEGERGESVRLRERIALLECQIESRTK
jgi:hypothetical protein